MLQKSSDDVKQALDQLRELGWAKRWSSQPYVSRRTVSAVPSEASMIRHHMFAGHNSAMHLHLLVQFWCKHPVVFYRCGCMGLLTVSVWL